MTRHIETLYKNVCYTRPRCTRRAIIIYCVGECVRIHAEAVINITLLAVYTTRTETRTRTRAGPRGPAVPLLAAASAYNAFYRMTVFSFAVSHNDPIPVL